jgi:O-antigen/teichoic acid export membrane protein
MSSNRVRLAPAGRRALLYGPVYRIAGTPVIATLGLANTAIIVRETGEAVFGLVSMVATITLLFPFADLGVGATVMSASALLSGPSRDPDAPDIIRRAYRVLFCVAGVVVCLALVVMALDGWGVLLGFSSGPADRWAVTVAACVFALTIPAGLGVRILIGIDRNPMATLVQMSCPLFALGLTLILYAVNATGIWYAVSSLGGLLIGLVIGTVLALHLSGLGLSAFAGLSRSIGRSGLLAGSLWLFLVSLGVPVGLQTGRVILAHLSTPAELSKYALMAQIYAVGWSVLSTAGMAYWPVFVKRRGAAEQTIRIWRQVTLGFAAIAIVAAAGMAVIGPWAATILSGGRIEIPTALAFAFGLLLVAQAVHLPGKVLLTTPDEARWQAMWTLGMAVLSIGLGCAEAERLGALGVVYAAAFGIFTAQALPILRWAPTLVRRRNADVSLPK